MARSVHCTMEGNRIITEFEGALLTLAMDAERRGGRVASVPPVPVTVPARQLRRWRERLLCAQTWYTEAHRHHRVYQEPMLWIMFTLGLLIGGTLHCWR